MSNLVVSTNFEGEVPSEYIEIVKLSKCFVNHQKKTIILHSQLAFHKCDSEVLARFIPFRMEFEIGNIYKNIHPIRNASNFIRPLQCFKQGQVIECSGVSCDWIINNPSNLMEG